MFEKVLVANRGEIALRVIRACRDLGVQSVAVYSQADADSLHVQLADRAICIGKAPASESYLKASQIIAAAEIEDVDAIHPGYGFLSENPQFADMCESCKIKFIGPSASAIKRMGDKAVARETARRAGVPITPGSDGIVETDQQALTLAHKIGYPIMIKAVAGGGGKGMRRVHNDVSLGQNFNAAKAEAEKAFGNGALYLEKLIENPHHIEIQVLADQFGKVVSLGERDCSIQRRNQKLIEEAPSPLMTNALRKAMGKAAIKLCSAVNYENAGTIEFLVDDAGNFYFMEMNTRIQVEHPVTEEVYGVDLVKEQLRIASGERLGKDFDNLEPKGHAIEMRINAEDPYHDWRPSPGKIDFYYPPGGIGVRLDSHAYSGYTIPPHYDSMIGKLIAYGEDRATAMDRLARALHDFTITGIQTTIPAGELILSDPDFRRGRYSTAFLENLMRQKSGLMLPRAE
ncbi:MAG: acetyl-CoA carboxylase biotin carboxylase subunit [Verrucomicrobiota bacterium]